MLDKINKIKNNKLFIPFILMLSMIIYYVIINIVLLNHWISAKFIDTAPLYFSLISVLILIVSLIIFGVKKTLTGFELFTYLEIITLLLFLVILYLFSQGRAGGFAYKNTFGHFSLHWLSLKTKIVDPQKSNHYIMEHNPESYKYIKEINVCALSVLIMFFHLLGTLLFTNVKIRKKSKKALESSEQLVENQSDNSVVAEVLSYDNSNKTVVNNDYPNKNEEC